MARAAKARKGRSGVLSTGLPLSAARESLFLHNGRAFDLMERRGARRRAQMALKAAATTRCTCSIALVLAVHVRATVDAHKDVLARQFAVGLERWQNPAVCDSKTPLMLFQQQRSGLGSQLNVLKDTMLNALAKGHVFSLANYTLVYVNPIRCASSGFECYFEPISNCTPIDASALPSSRIKCLGNRKDMTGRELSTALARLTAIEHMVPLGRELSSTWLRAQLMQYVMRPNAQLLANIVRMEKLLGFDASVYETALAVHVRHGDKSSEAKLHSFEEYMNRIGYIHAGNGGISTIFLGSDDQNATERMQGLLDSSRPRMHDIRLVVMPPDMFVTSSSEYLARQRRPSKNARKQVISFYHKLGPDLSAELDEGMALLTQIFIMVRCRFVVGTFSSNIGQLIYLLRHGGRFEHFHDMDGAPFYPCGSDYKWPFGGGYVEPVADSTAPG